PAPLPPHLAAAQAPGRSPAGRPARLNAGRPPPFSSRWAVRADRFGRVNTLGDVLRQRAATDADRPFLLFEDTRLTYRDGFGLACRYANLFLARRDPGRPFHVGLLLENRPEFVLAELGAALAGAVVVGLNPTRRGAP